MKRKRSSVAKTMEGAIDLTALDHDDDDDVADTVGAKRQREIKLENVESERAIVEKEGHNSELGALRKELDDLRKVMRYRQQSNVLTVSP